MLIWRWLGRLIVMVVGGSGKAMPRVSFSFIADDIERQRRMSRDALERARALDAQIEAIQDEAAKRALIESRDALLALARDLAESANTTSQIATTVVSSASST